jgi:steroid delta-isomerase-like uncharacterized protein
MPTTTQAPADIARAIFDAVARRDADAVVAFNAEDCVDHFVALGFFHGRAAVRELFVELFAAFPDFTMSVDRIVGDETTAAVQWRAVGTFTGAPFRGIAATGRPVAISGCDVMEITDGVMRRNTIYYDGASFARQIGLLPPEGSAADRAMLRAFNVKSRLRRRR